MATKTTRTASTTKASTATCGSARRTDLLRRKDVIMGAIEKAAQANPMTEDERKGALLMLDGIELLLDILIDVAHPVKGGSV